MPSRRRTRRAVYSVRSGYARTKSSRLGKKIRASRKPRLVRRYVGRKQHHGPTIHGKHSDSTYLPVSEYSGDRIHNAVAVNKKNSSLSLVVKEFTAVPNPTPDSGTGIRSLGVGSPLLGAIADTSTSGLIVASNTVSPLAASMTPFVTFSALPPLPTLAPSSTGKSRIYGASSVYLPVETTPPKTPNNATQSPKVHSVNLAVTVLLAVGSTLLILGACITIKMCRRTKPQRPTPSLPMLNDSEPDDDFFETKESPIFGGKERLSPMPGVGGPTWAWVQYPHSRLVQEATRASEAVTDTHFPLAPQASSKVQSDVCEVPYCNQANFLSPAHANRRRSASSASFYSPRIYATIGQAITQDRETPLTADGLDVIQRSKNKTLRSQFGSVDKQRRRGSTTSSFGLAYDGEETYSPDPVEYMQVEKMPVQSSTYEGRERIRSGYFAAGTYPRISTLPSATYSIATATRVNVGQRNSFSRDKCTLQRSNSRRHRDTQALSYALGLATPDTKHVAQSPQPTLYQDDSMSFADARRYKKRNPSERKPIESLPDVPVIVPSEKGSRDSGMLMAMDFGVSQMSLSALTMDPMAEEVGGQNLPAVPSPLSRTTDKPPRVPSPPAFPSLAQMALAQHNPDAYANYRSPTYSLYGLYESPERKSVMR